MIKIPLISAVCVFAAIKEMVRIRNEQDAYTLLKALKLRILHDECVEHLLKTEPRGKHLLRHGEKILMRKYYGEDGTVTHHQRIKPKHILPELTSTLHAKTNKQPRNHKDYTRRQSELLLSRTSTKN